MNFVINAVFPTLLLPYKITKEAEGDLYCSSKKHNSFYYVEHQRDGDDLIINFYLISVDSEFQCGIIYDANLPKRKIKNKFII